MDQYVWMNEIINIEGYNRSCLYDISRNKKYLVPKEIKNILIQINTKKKIKSNEKEWFDFLIENEIILKVPLSTVSNFCNINLEWHSSSEILNASVENNIDIKNILIYLDQLLCKYVLIYCDNIKEVEIIAKENLKITNFLNVDFVLKEYHPSDENLKEYLKTNYSSIGEIYHKTTTVLKNENFSPFFIINIDFFTESQKHNIYFNKKIHIDINGDVSNSVESIIKIDKYSNLKFKDLINKELWFLSKDKIDICKDCELRHMCYDNRIPLKRKKNEWYNKNECIYNPYICKWQGEEGYKTLAECGVFSDENGFSIDHEKIAAINNELWGED